MISLASGERTSGLEAIDELLQAETDFSTKACEMGVENA